jgi:hypothetical protein
MLTRPVWETMSVAVISALVGAATVVIHSRDRHFTAQDMMEARELGESRALDVVNPSERLEAVCAALWLKGQHDPVDQK